MNVPRTSATSRVLLTVTLSIGACVGSDPTAAPGPVDGGSTSSGGSSGGSSGTASSSGSSGATDGGDDSGPSFFDITLATKLTPPADGSVSISPTGVGCGPNCNRYAAGTSVTVSATPNGPNDFQAWLGECKGFQTTCTFSVSKTGTVTGWFRPRLNYMFVTSKKYPLSTLGTGGTLKNADDACDAAAQAASLTGATGTYKAWLGTTTQSPAARFTNKSVWIRVDGRLFGNKPYDFGGPGDGTYTKSKLVYYPPRIDENGKDLVDDADTKVAVGTIYSGETLDPSYNCNNWTGTAGSAFAGNLSDGALCWAGDFDAVQCNTSARIYCFETVFNTSPTLPTPTGHMAFVTTGSYTPSTAAAADTLCQNEATANSLLNPTTFKAFFSTAAQSAIARLGTTTAGPWVRPDGVEVAANATDLGAGKLLAPIGVTAAKEYIGSIAWTGGATTPSTMAATAQDACTNWTAASGNGVYGVSCTTKPRFWSSFNAGCGTGQKLYCLQP